MAKKTKSTIYHDKIAEEYESSYSEPYWQLYFDVTWHTIKKYLPEKEGARILDAGGGTGYWSRKLAEKGYYIVCSDIAERMLEVGLKLAKRQNLEKKIEFKHADITDMNCFEENSFDMVIAQGDPVGYYGNPQKAIDELSRVAKIGAYVSISVDSFYPQLGWLLSNNNYEKIDALLENGLTEFSGGFPQYNFRVDELKTMFEKSCLEYIEGTGKLVFTRFIQREKLNKLLSDNKFYRKILELEITFNNDPSVIGLCSHIAIIGRKKFRI
ncbi:MAG: class I SAM-dependent methyltransferase [Promethearchaeota archaeon]|jgi:ubiquinone/menaquinone biosynthesis C-methylase UbiE